MRVLSSLVILCAVTLVSAQSPGGVRDAAEELEQADLQLTAAQQRLAEALAKMHKKLDDLYGAKVGKVSPAMRPASSTLTIPKAPTTTPIPPPVPTGDVNNPRLEVASAGVGRLIPAKSKVGTAWVIARGYLVSVHHNVGKEDEIKVRLPGSPERMAKVVHREPKLDMVVLEVDTGKIEPLVIAAKPRVTERVWVIGSPFGYDESVTSGIVSYIGRSITLDNGVTLEGCYQTDAAINPGNSGGPMVNALGHVLGMVDCVRDGSNGISFIIPAEQVEAMFKRFQTKQAPSSKAKPQYWTNPIKPVSSEEEKVPELLPMPKEVPAPKSTLLIIKTPKVVRWIHVDGELHGPHGSGNWWFYFGLDAGTERTLTVIAGGVTRRVVVRAGQTVTEDFIR